MGVKLHSPPRLLRRRVDHASFRGQHPSRVGLPQALVGRNGEPRFGARLKAQQTFAASPMPSSTRADDPVEGGS